MKKFSAIFKSIFFSFVFLTMAVFGIGGAVLSEQAPEETLSAAAEVESQSTADVAYLYKNWTYKVYNSDNSVTPYSIKTITFTNELPTGVALCSVGSILEEDGSFGTSDYTETEGLSDVLVYVTSDTTNSAFKNIKFYAPGKIYAPTDSSYLFSKMHPISIIDYKNLENLQSINFNGAQFDTSFVTNMSYMFANCSSLNSIELSCFDTSNVTNMFSMFDGCSSLSSIDVSSFDTSNVTDMSHMFSSLNVDVLNLDNFNTNKVERFSGMFYYCEKLTQLDLTGFVTKNAIGLNSMFEGCSLLNAINMSNWDTSSVTNMDHLFRKCTAFETLDLTIFNTESVKIMGLMFDGCTNLSRIEFSTWNTGNVTTMAGMFKDCSSLTDLDVSHFDTKNVTSMYEMFKNCSSLTTLDITNFNTANVEYFSEMFYACSSLVDLELGNFEENDDFFNASDMFSYCSSLLMLDLSSWDFYCASRSQFSMFYGMDKLQSLKVPTNMNADTVIYLPKVFYNIENDNLYTTINYTNCSKSTSDPITIVVGMVIDYQLDSDALEENNENNVSVIFASQEVQTIILYEPSKTGCNFISWEIDSFSPESVSLEGNVLTIPVFYTDDTIYLVANFEKLQYKISFTVDGGEEIEDKVYEIEYDANQTISLENPVKNGHTFVSWIINKNTENGTSYLSENDLVVVSKAYGDIELKAIWEINIYSISFVTNNGESVESLNYNISQNSQEKVLESLTESSVGYYFSGWEITTNAQGAVAEVSNGRLIIPKDAYGNIILTAKWDLIDYLIAFDVNGGNAMSNKYYNISNENQEILIENPIRKGYSFTEWIITQNSQAFDSNLNNGNVVIYAGAYGNIQLKANWVANVYKVTFELKNGDSNWSTTSDYTFGVAYGALPVPEKEGYNFKGWYLDEEFTQEVTAESLVNVDADHKLYAKFEKINFFETTTGYIVLGAGGGVALGTLVGCIAGIAKARKKRKRI